MTTGSTHVLIVGAGPGGLEAALALQALAGERVDIELLSAVPTFEYRPWSTAQPFGIGHSVEVDLTRMAAERGFRFTQARMEAVDPAEHVVSTDAGPVPYDQLVLALGTHQVPAVAGALMFRGGRDVRGLRIALEQRAAEPGARVAYVVNRSACWPLPAYELALMTRVWGERRETPVNVALVTAESTPLESFGPTESGRVRDLLSARGISLYTGTVVESFSSGRLLEPGAGSIPADLAVAMPALVGRPIPGIPRDVSGFVPVDDHARVEGLDDIYAVGDMTARPLKQGGLSTQQADVAAAAIARTAGAVIESLRYRPILRAVLLTGEGPVYLRNPEAPVGDSRPTDQAFEAPWWPPHKIAGRHLAPYLATHADLLTPIGADA